MRPLILAAIEGEDEYSGRLGSSARLSHSAAAVIAATAIAATLGRFTLRGRRTTRRGRAGARRQREDYGDGRGEEDCARAHGGS